MKDIRISIVTRLSIVIGALVLGTALIIYIGDNYRMARLYRDQRDTRIRLLAQSMSYGIKNYLVMSDSKDHVSSIARDVLERAMSADPSIMGCEVEDDEGEMLFSYIFSGLDIGKTPSLKMGVYSDSGKIGNITIYYNHKNVLENEKTNQVVAIASTVAAMVRYHLRKVDYFQVRFLAQKVMEEDADILYSSIAGAGGEDVFSYRIEEFSNLITPEVSERARGVSTVQPVVVQELGTTDKYGPVVEVAVLVQDGTRRFGVVRIGYSMAALAEELRRSRLMLTLIVVGATVLAFGLAMLMARSITRPLGDLTNIARSVSPHDFEGGLELDDIEKEIMDLADSFGDLDERLSTRGDEVAELATSFKDMVHNLEIFIKQLKVFYQKISIADRLYAMGELSAGVAHEINNPLTIISTYTQIMLKSPDLTPDLKEDLDTIKDEIKRISEKVKELQSFSQESKFEFLTHDINQILIKTLDLCKHQIKRGDISLTTDINEKLALNTKVDAGKMRQVFLNLILNAIQAMSGSDKKELLVSTEIVREGNEIRVIIRDTGYGIEPENIGKIFNPFFTTKGPGSGTGLGLAICYSILISHGGNITVSSEHGDGTEFTVILPVKN